MSQTSVTWYTPFEDSSPPKKGDPLTDFVSELWEILGTLSAQELPEDSIRRHFSKYCEALDWPWPHIARQLRRDAIAASLANHDPDKVEKTSSGIPIYTDLFDHWQSICPWKLKNFHIGHWTVQTRDKLCESLSERKCAPKEVEDHLNKVRIRINGLDVVHVAEVEYDDGLFNRMNGRRYSKHFNSYTYRSIDDTVFIISDAPHGGIAPPRSTEPMSPSEAIERLVPRLWVPGHHSHEFSQGWAFPSATDEGGTTSVSLKDLSHEQVEEFEERADALLESLGLRPRVDRVPGELWETVRQGLIDIKKAIINGD